MLKYGSFGGKEMKMVRGDEACKGRKERKVINRFKVEGNEGKQQL